MRNIKELNAHYKVILIFATIVLLSLVTISGYCGNCEISYRNEKNYNVTQEAIIDFNNAGGNNNKIHMQFVFPASRTWPETKGASNEKMNIYPNNWSPKVGHYHFSDTDYFYYWFKYDYWNLPKKMTYTYRVQPKNTILSGKLDTTFTEIKEYVNKNTELNKYLKASSHLEIDNKILEIRERIYSKRGKPSKNGSVLKTVKDFYDYIYDNAKYNDTNSYKFNGTVDFKNTMYGQCGDYSALLIALCRSIGLPSRPVVGAWIGSKKNKYHVWSEHYFPYVGWVPIDITVDQIQNQRYKRIGNLPAGNERLILSKDYDIYISQVEYGFNNLPLLQVVNWWWWYTKGKPKMKPSVKSNIWGEEVN